MRLDAVFRDVVLRIHGMAQSWDSFRDPSSQLAFLHRVAPAIRLNGPSAALSHCRLGLCVIPNGIRAC